MTDRRVAQINPAPSNINPSAVFQSAKSAQSLGKEVAGPRRGPHYNERVYSAELLDHFQNPRNAGEVENADATVRVENPVCGDVLELSLKMNGDQIADIRFRAKGCVPAMACGSAMTELAKGKTVAAAQAIGREELLQTVGGLPESSSHASYLAMDALKALLRAL